MLSGPSRYPSLICRFVFTTLLLLLPAVEAAAQSGHGDHDEHGKRGKHQGWHDHHHRWVWWRWCNRHSVPNPSPNDCNGNGLDDRYDLAPESTPSSDACSGALPIAPLEPGKFYTGTTHGRLPDGNAPSCHSSGSNGSSDVYYRYTPESDGMLSVSLCGSEFDAVVSVHVRCPANAASEMACSNTADGCADGSALSIPVEEGVTYFIRIAGARPHDHGVFRLTIDGPSTAVGSNDCDANATPDECQSDADADELIDSCDNCALSNNPGQEDADGDGRGDLCDACATDPSKQMPGICGCGVADTDSDGDGTADCHDLCIGDSTKTVPGTCGCGTSDLDSDRDGSADCVDECASDPGKSVPGRCGCGVSDRDTDLDGTPDCNDQCPINSGKVAPGVCGCATPDVDTDRDGRADCQDACPHDPSKITQGVCGCGVPDADSDHDGSADCLDRCPLDVNKTAPGACGCGASESDADGDATPDCTDLCPNDPGKTQSGVCGCGVSDIDADGDGTPSCRDACPGDQNKTQPGVCGCGRADTDSDQDGLADCLDACSSDPGKTQAGVCGCGVADVDDNHDGVFDCLCSGSCNPGDPFKDEDGDGVSNCDEIDDGTAVCDSGSYISKLAAVSCTPANGYLSQTNIVSVVNHLPTPLTATIHYRDSGGVLRGGVTITLGALLKQDVSVNDIGLVPDSYGTVCVSTSAPVEGAWSGGVTLYKPRYDGAGNPSGMFDFALYYPFSNAHHGMGTAPLNTNSIGAQPASFVANWIRISDSTFGDGRGIGGYLRFYNQSGALVQTRRVDIGEGGGFDFGGHEAIGANAVGLAEFAPDDPTAPYYMVETRYLHDGPLNNRQNFLTAFAVPNRPPTGAGITGRVANQPGEISIVEMVNGSGAGSTAALRLFNRSGGKTAERFYGLSPKASVHEVITDSLLPPNTIGSAEVSGAVESIAAITMIYHFDAAGRLEYAYAPSFVESPGRVQFTDFNTFIGHWNTLEISNTTDQAIPTTVRVIDYAGVGFTLTMSIAPRATSITNLPPPLDRYGTIIVDSGSRLGLIVRNDILRASQYVIPLSSR